MKLVEKCKVGIDLLAARSLGKRRPLIVGWSLTKRCNLQCRYCSVWSKEHPELPTEQVMKLITQMIAAGTRRISFTGGEPLMREDIGEIVSFCSRLGASVGMNSNGSLVADKMKDLKDLDVLKLSLDGPMEIHDYLRGAGTYAQVMEAVRVAKDHNLKVSFSCVISTQNLDHLEAMVRLAGELNTSVTFQPATPYLLGSDGNNVYSPKTDSYQQAIARLIELKMAKAPIGNSLPVLHHFQYWPQGRLIRCAGGMVSCRVEPDGRVYHCGRVLLKGLENDATKVGFKAAFESLKPLSCQQCWCAPRLEMNFIYQLNPRALLNIVNTV